MWKKLMQLHLKFQIKEDTYNNLIESSSIPDLSSSKIKKDDGNIPKNNEQTQQNIKDTLNFT